MFTNNEITELIEYNAKKRMQIVEKRKDIVWEYSEKLELKTRLYRRFLIFNDKK